MIPGAVARRFLAVLAGSLLFALPPAGLTQWVGGNVNVSRLSGDQLGPSIAIDPANPDRLFVASYTIGEGLFASYSTNGGATWFWTDPADGTIADGRDALPEACCNPWLGADCDPFGNLFLAYLKTAVPRSIVVIVSTNAGRSFGHLATLASGRDVDTPKLATGCNIGSAQVSLWVTYKDFSLPFTPLVAQGASIDGLGAVGPFGEAQTIPFSASGNFGDIAVGPAGQVVVAFQETLNTEGPSSIHVSVDPDGHGPQGFGSPIFVADTATGAFEKIPATPERGTCANPALAWDLNPVSAFFGRLYLCIADESPDESDDLNILVLHSDDAGANWNGPVRLNDDATARSQFFPFVAVDPVSGAVAAAWYDCRNDAGGGATDRAPGPNNDVELFASVSFDGGQTWSPNVRVSSGVSSEAPAANPSDYGDNIGLVFNNGSLYPVWVDNSNSTGNNPDGSVSMEIYTSQVQVGFVTDGPVLFLESCGPPNGALDPGETVTVELPLRNVLGPDAANLIVALLPGGGVSAPGSPQTYGALPAGGPSVSRVFSFDVDRSCGGILRATWELRDGVVNRGTVSFNFPVGVRTTNTQTFISPGLITIPEFGEAAPYPRNLEVVGYQGVPDKITVTLNGLNHSYPDDLDILLVGPRGERVILMSDVGYEFAANSLNLIFDDLAIPLPDASPLRSGAFAPANYSPVMEENDQFPPSAPPSPYAGTLDVFSGRDPNGTWSLFLNDDTRGDSGTVVSGWSIRFWKLPWNCCASPVTLRISHVSSGVEVSWPTAALGYQLEANGELVPGIGWEPVTNSVVRIDGRNVVRLPPEDPRRFFRLRQ